MKEFFAVFEKYFWKMWNELYKYLCEALGEEVNEDWLVPVE